MITPNSQSNPEDAVRRFITAADYFLGRREFDECRKFTTRAKNCDPIGTNPEPDRILAILSVLSVPNLSSNSRDYYAILNLPRFERSVDRIWSNYENLDSVLNPRVNSHPLSGEAHDLASKALAVLSDPAGKARFDADLRRISGCPEIRTFWTMCPYCYYVYEFDRAFVDCCLKCSNERCERVLHAVEITAPPPPAELVEKGYYLCPGFAQFVSPNTNGESSWVPFDCRGGNDYRFMENDLRQTGKRRKAYVHWQSKKMMGRGVKVDTNKVHSVLGDFEGRHLNLDGSNGNDSMPGFGGETKNDGAGGVEFYEGDDDVLVGVESELDLDLAHN